jgi:hypothetical protein
MGKSLRPGQPAPRSGQYEVVGPRGGRTGHEVTMPRDHTLPPTPEPGQGYVLVDPSRNDSGKP